MTLTLTNIRTRPAGKFRLENLSLSLAPAEQIAILGPNGSGKSTLLRLIAGLDVPESGTICWSDTILSQPNKICIPPNERNIALLFQEGVLFPHLSVRQNIALGLGSTKNNQNLAAGRIDDIMQLLSIASLNHRQIPTLSGGEQQRVALARALLQEPRLLLLDEPLYCLDGPTKRLLLVLLNTIARQKNISMILVTHDPLEASAFARRIILLRDGKKIQEGTMEQLYRQPVDEWEANFVGPLQKLSLDLIHQYQIGLPQDTLDATDVTVFFRPEDLQLIAAESGLTVIQVTSQGAAAEVKLQLNEEIIIYALAPSDTPLKPGQKVKARLTRIIEFKSSEGRAP